MRKCWICSVFSRSLAALRAASAQEGKLIDAKGVKARYVRLYSKGNTSNDLNHYIEVAVYGKPAQ